MTRDGVLLLVLTLLARDLEDLTELFRDEFLLLLFLGEELAEDKNERRMSRLDCGLVC